MEHEGTKWNAEHNPALEKMAPSATFDREAIRDRVAHTIAGAAPANATKFQGRWLRIAAGLILFVAGALAGRLGGPSTTPPLGALAEQTGQAVLPSVIEPADIPLTIQSTGTRYLSSVAMLSELSDRLTPSQRAQAREVATSVLIGALTELLVTSDALEPRLVRQLASICAPLDQSEGQTDLRCPNGLGGS